MLTFVQQQVNFFAMSDHQSKHYQPDLHLDHTAQQALTARILQPLMARRRPQRVLILKHEAAADVVLSASVSAEIVSLSNQTKPAGAQLYARLDALPFEDLAFELVVIQHLISDGSEALLAEAIRVLASGGDIIISGLNYAGLRYHSTRRGNRYPGLKINRTIFHLNSNRFSIRHCLRSGFMGMSRPLAHEGFSGLSIPFTDLVVIHARHRSGAEPMVLSRLDKVRSATMSSAAFDGARNRESLL